MLTKVGYAIRQCVKAMPRAVGTAIEWLLGLFLGLAYWLIYDIASHGLDDDNFFTHALAPQVLWSLTLIIGLYKRQSLFRTLGIVTPCVAITLGICGYVVSGYREVIMFYGGDVTGNQFPLTAVSTLYLIYGVAATISALPLMSKEAKAYFNGKDFPAISVLKKTTETNQLNR